MRVISAEAIDAALDVSALVTALDEAFRGDIVTPVRHHHHIHRPEGDATLLLMPAWSGPGSTPPVTGIKIVGVHPGNAARGLPSVQGVYLLMDGETGTPLAIMDGARLTLWRTASASALAVREMARADAAHLLMVGAGALAPFLIRAHAAVRPLTRVSLWSRRPEAARALAASLDDLARRGCAVTPVTDLRAAVGAADIISCATLSRAPLVEGAWLPEGCHLDLVGAFTPAMRETDAEALHRARVVVDTEAALSEGGDVTVAINEGLYPREAVLGDLAALLRGAIVARRDARDITLFKSVGTALEDLAAAALVAARLPPASAA